MSKSEIRSRVYTNRPKYADYPSEEKFQAIQCIMITHLKRHPNAICSYSGGSDSDILIDFYRQKYNEYKAERMKAEKAKKSSDQMTLDDLMET